MPSAIAVHSVGDFDTWISKKNRAELFPAFCKSYRVYRLGDSNKVAIVMEGVDVEKFGAMLSSPEAAAAKAEDTVLEPVELLVELEGAR